MDRYLNSLISDDLTRKIVLLSGPRQCGKTTLSKQLYSDYEYFNYDNSDHRIALREKSWDRSKPLIIFDELHKMTHWKRWLKGIYDTENLPPAILVTGSAKLNTYRRVGDSLAGRYFQYRLHPLDIQEAHQHFPTLSLTALYDRLVQCSGFPEPFLENDVHYYQRWRRTHLDIILRQDLLDFHHIRDIQGIETLVALLRQRAGKTVSYANLARDLERDPGTVKRWLTMLENLYVIFRVTPYHRNIARSLLKEPKFYFYDCAQITKEDHGATLENLVACTLRKHLDYYEDTKGYDTTLHFLRTKDGREIDFLITLAGQPRYLIEVKWSDDNPSKHFRHFLHYLPEDIQAIQLVKQLKRNKSYPDGLIVTDALAWLAMLRF